MGLRARRWWCRACKAWVITLPLVLAGAAHAQGIGLPDAAPSESASAAGTIDIDRLEGLVATLEEPAAREELVAQLKALIALARSEAAEPEDAGPLGAGIASGIDALVDAVAESTSAIVDLPDLWDWTIGRAAGPGSPAHGIEALARVAGALLAGALAFWVWHGVTARVREQLRATPSEAGLAARIRALVGHTLWDAAAVAVFALVGLGALVLLDPRPIPEAIALALIKATALSLLLLVVARAVLAPTAPGLRFLTLTDRSAAYGYVWIRRFGCVVVYSYFILQIELLLHIPPSVLRGLENLVGFVVTLMAVALILQNRSVVASWLRGATHAEGQAVLARLRGAFASIWHLLAVAYVISAYLVWALMIPGGFALLMRGTVATTLALLAAGPLAQAAQRITAQAVRSAGAESRRAAWRGRLERYAATLSRIAVAIVYLAIALLVLRVWGLDLVDWLRGSLGATFVGRLVDLALVFAFLLVIWELFGAFMEGYLGAVGEAGAPVERSARMRTLLPLLRSGLLVMIGIIVVLHTMSVLGVDMAPLLATAGVIGIAIGFGSQKLVQDVITGLFVLFENTIAVGDVVDAGGHRGLVERISVRTIELRDLEGIVHTIPFSEVSTVMNWARGFAHAVLDVGIAYREDVDEVMEVLRQLGAELEADPKFGQSMLEPIEILGLEAFADSAVVIRARIKTLPLKQWEIKREFNRRMKRRFDELGIEIPFPHQTVYFGVDKEGRAPPANLHLDPAPASGTTGLRVIETSDPAHTDGKS